MSLPLGSVFDTAFLYTIINRLTMNMEKSFYGRTQKTKTKSMIHYFRHWLISLEAQGIIKIVEHQYYEPKFILLKSNQNIDENIDLVKEIARKLVEDMYRKREK